MAIRVTCPGCHTRFNVSDKFAGREGPCPKCKANIRIPDRRDEVVIHAPEDANPKRKNEAAIARPIFRTEVVVTPLWWTVILGVIATLFAMAVLIRYQIADKANSPQWFWILPIGALIVAVPAVYGAYGVLRDSELQGHLGRDLWVRVFICAALYAALWLVMDAAAYAVHGYDTMSWSIGMAIMIALGGAIAMAVWDLDYMVGVLHYGMYLGCALLLRWIMGVEVLPGKIQSETEVAVFAVGSMASELVQRLF